MSEYHEWRENPKNIWRQKRKKSEHMNIKLINSSTENWKLMAQSLHCFEEKLFPTYKYILTPTINQGWE